MSWAKAPPRVKFWTADELPGPRVPLISLQLPAAESPTLIITKELILRSEKFRRWVASRPCEHCGKQGESQCAHSDAAIGGRGKGMSIKASDEHCYSLCVRCHAGIGSQGWFKKEHRRHLEARYVKQTQEAAKSCGAWPEGWPR